MKTFKKLNGLIRLLAFILLTGMFVSQAYGQRNDKGEYTDWPKWEGARTKWIGAYMLQLRKTISFQEYKWLQNNRAWRFPEDCSKVIELKSRLYTYVPSGCDYCKTNEERKAQKEVNLNKLYRACEFDWYVNDFIKQCHKKGYGNKNTGKFNSPKPEKGTGAASSENRSQAQKPPSSGAQASPSPIVTSFPGANNNHASGNQEINFQIKGYPINSPSLSASIDRDMASGTSPVGLNYSGNLLQILFLSPDIFNMKSWRIEYYKTTEEISSGVTSKMQDEKMLPMGMTSDGAGLSFLFIRSHTLGTAWQLIESKQELTDVSHDIAPYLRQGYFPVAITLHGDSYYTLLIKLNNNPFTSWEIKGYQNVTKMKSEIQQHIAQNKIPFGFLENKGVYNILYVGLQP